MMKKKMIVKLFDKLLNHDLNSAGNVVVNLNIRMKLLFFLKKVRNKKASKNIVKIIKWLYLHSAVDIYVILDEKDPIKKSIIDYSSLWCIDSYSTLDKEKIRGFCSDFDVLIINDISIFAFNESLEDYMPITLLLILDDEDGRGNFLSNVQFIKDRSIFDIAILTNTKETYHILFETLGINKFNISYVQSEKRILKNLNLDILSPKVLGECRKISNKPHPVSVIVPNYNYEQYLPQRLKSIFSQSFKDYDIIILDDASTDKSIDIIDQCRTYPNLKIIINVENSGNVFNQWIKGIKETKGNIIWIAEADDYCNNDFLEKMLEPMKDPSIVISYSLPVIVDSNGNYVGKFPNDGHINNIHSCRWKKSYVNSGYNEIRDCLSKINIMVNASAILFRKIDIEMEELKTYSYGGDWLFYLMLLNHGNVAFVKGDNSFFRRHRESVFMKRCLNIVPMEDDDERVKKYANDLLFGTN